MATLRLPAAMGSFETFRSFVLREMENEGDLEELIPRVDLVLEEVLVNVINYAYPQGSGEIEVECGAGGKGEFQVTVKDWGVPFNPMEQDAPDLSSDISSRKVGGLGVYLVKEMTSRLAYEFRNGGNVLTLGFTKRM
ncbi:MAG: ATP-binding protein [Syntrophobacteraceae bacterium]